MPKLQHISAQQSHLHAKSKIVVQAGQNIGGHDIFHIFYRNFFIVAQQGVSYEMRCAVHCNRALRAGQPTRSLPNSRWLSAQ